jgi:hypothetical protein
MQKFRFVLSLVLLPMASALVCGAAGATDTPTDTDLKSACCLRAINLELQAVTAVIGKETPDSAQAAQLKPTVDRYKVDIDRLNSYLFPKLPKLDPAAIVAASQRADRDDSARPAEMQKCSAQCASEAEPGGKLGQKWLACARACRQQSPSFARMDACHPVDWLPF